MSNDHPTTLEGNWERYKEQLTATEAWTAEQLHNARLLFYSGAATLAGLQGAAHELPTQEERNAAMARLASEVQSHLVEIGLSDPVSL